MPEIHTAPERSLRPSGNKQIRERAFAFSLRAIQLFQHAQEQKGGAGWVMGKQFLRVAGSIGANVEEVQSGAAQTSLKKKPVKALRGCGCRENHRLQSSAR